MINLVGKSVRMLSFITLSAMLFTSCGSEVEKVENADTVSEQISAEEELAEVTVSQAIMKGEKDVDENVEEVAGDWNNSDAYDLTQVDVPPLFDASCSTAVNARRCSDEKLLRFIDKNVKKPRGWNKSSLEQVLVIIEKDGSIRGVKYVASGNKDGCPECQQAAMDVIGKIKKWTPAIKDGKTVAVKMAIPVRFG